MGEPEGRPTLIAKRVSELAGEMQPKDTGFSGLADGVEISATEGATGPTLRPPHKIQLSIQV